MRMRLVRVGTHPVNETYTPILIPRVGNQAYQKWMQTETAIIEEVCEYIYEHLSSMAVDDYVFSIDEGRLYRGVAKWLYDSR